MAGKTNPDGIGSSGSHDHEAEIIVGTSGNDTLTAGGGPQIIYGYNGHDTIRAGGGPDRCYGGNGNDAIFGQGGPDTCYGCNGNDAIFGQGGPDTCYGCNGNDTIVGAGGPDRLFGGNGDDILTGGAAADLLAGGRGADVYVYTGPGDTGGGDGHGGGHGGGEGDEHGAAPAVDAGGNDGHTAGEIIVGFQPGADTIDLAALPGDFSFIGVIADESAFTAARQVAVLATASGCSVIVNVEGADAAELVIGLPGVSAAALGADDFLLA